MRVIGRLCPETFDWPSRFRPVKLALNVIFCPFFNLSVCLSVCRRYFLLLSTSRSLLLCSSLWLCFSLCLSLYVFLYLHLPKLHLTFFLQHSSKFGLSFCIFVCLFLFLSFLHSNKRVLCYLYPISNDDPRFATNVLWDFVSTQRFLKPRSYLYEAPHLLYAIV